MNEHNGNSRSPVPGLTVARGALLGASAVALATASPILAAGVRNEECPAPSASRSLMAVPASMRIYDQDPAFRDMARADLLVKQGRKADAAAIYRRYITVAPDHRQTARRAQLRLAQVLASQKDFGGAEGLVATATGPGATPDLVDKGRQVRATIAYRRAVAAAEDRFETINPLVAAGRYDEAARTAQSLLQLPCPYPVDYRARVRARLAQVYRARQDYPQAKAMALQARATAHTPAIRQGAAKLIAEIDAAAFAAGLRAQVGQANDLAEAGNHDGAIAILQPLVLRRDVPSDIAAMAGLRLAHAYRANDDFAHARAAALQAQARAGTAERRQSAATLIAEIDQAAFVAGLRAQIVQANGLIEANNPTGAIGLLQPLVARGDVPPEIATRARLRLAHAYALAGQYDLATATVEPLLASGVLDADGRRQAVGVIMRAQIAKGNALIETGNPTGAIAVLEPVVQRADGPPEIGLTARLRLARAYSLAGRHDDARNLIEPLRLAGQLDDKALGSAAHIYLARANALENGRDYAAADPAYRELIGWNAGVEPEVRNNARLGLARSLLRRGQRGAALDQVMLVRADTETPDLRPRANALLADIQGDIVPGRLVGYVEAGIAYDSNAPTFVTAQDENDTEVAFPANQRFSDTHVQIAGRLQYRQPIGHGDDTIDFSAAALRTFQFNLPQLDRTRIELSAGPSFAMGTTGSTRLLAGVNYAVEWRGSQFRSSEPGLYAGIRTGLGPDLSLTAVYTLGFHNDYRPERDGIDHQLDAVLRYDIGAADVITFDLRGTREGGKVDTFRNWRLLAGADWTHRWHEGARTVPFVSLGGTVERVWFDGQIDGVARRDTKLRIDAEAGVEIDRKWRASLHYAFADINSNLPTRDRLSDHQVGVTLRYLWN